MSRKVNPSIACPGPIKAATISENIATLSGPRNGAGEVARTKWIGALSVSHMAESYK